MEIQSKPDYLIFANDAKTGELIDFPTILRGWGITLEQTQGKPPLEWMNSAFNRIDRNMLYLLQQGVPEWDGSVLYPINAIVKYKSVLYVAKAENNSAIPSTNTTKWLKLIKDASLTEKGIVQLSSEIDSDSEEKAPTLKAISEVNKKVDEALKTAQIPIGHIYWGLNLDASSLHLNGQLCSRSAYAELWAYIQSVPQLLVSDSKWQAEKKANNGICNKFSSGNGSTTFRLPVFEYVKGGGLGYQKAGVPNIEGEFGSGSAGFLISSTSSGAFTSGSAAKAVLTGSNTVSNLAKLDASLSSSIYGSSDSVDLNAVKGFWQIKAIGKIADVGSTEIANMLNQINLLRDEAITKNNIQNYLIPDVEYDYLDGTESSPMVIEVNNEYIYPDKYAGKSVLYVPQVKIKNIWLDVDYIYDSNIGRGVKVTAASDGNILIATGGTNIVQNSKMVVGIPSSYLPSTTITSVPFRLKIVK